MEPLVAYTKHPWRAVYRMFGQLCNALIQHNRLSFHAANPRMVLEKVHVFNQGERRRNTVMKQTMRKSLKKSRKWGGRKKKETVKQFMKLQQRETRVLKMFIVDIANFFVMVPREIFKKHLKGAINRIQKRNPKLKYFGVERELHESVDATIPRSGLMQGGWRRVKPSVTCPKTFLEKPKREWRCMDLSEVEEFLEWDRRYGVVMVLGQESVPIDGFTIGGNAAAGAACLHAASEETEEVEQQPWKVQHEVETMVMSERWSDDLLIVWDMEVKKSTQNLIARLTDEEFYKGE